MQSDTTAVGGGLEGAGRVLDHGLRDVRVLGLQGTAVEVNLVGIVFTISICECAKANSNSCIKSVK